MSNKVNNHIIMPNISTNSNQVEVKKNINPIQEDLGVLDSNLLKESVAQKLSTNDSDVNLNNIVAGKLTLMYNNLQAIYDLVKDKEFQLLKSQLNSDYETYVADQDIDSFNDKVNNKLNTINNDLKNKIILSVTNIFANSINDNNDNSYNKNQVVSLGQALAFIFSILYKMQVENSKLDSDTLTAQMKYFKDFITTLSSILVKYEEVEQKQNQAAMLNLAGAVTGLVSTVGGFALSTLGMHLHRNSHIDKLSNDAGKLKTKMDEFFKNKDNHNVLTKEEQINLKKNFLNLTEEDKKEFSNENQALNLRKGKLEAQKKNSESTKKLLLKEKQTLEKQGKQPKKNESIELELYNNIRSRKVRLGEINEELTNLEQIEPNLIKVNSHIKGINEALDLSTQYQNLSKFKEELFKKDGKHVYQNDKIHHLEHKDSLSVIVEGLEDSKGNIITASKIKELLGKNQNELSIYEMSQLHKVAKLQELYAQNDFKKAFFTRFKQVKKSYEDKQRRYSQTGDTMQGTSRFISTSIEASAGVMTAQATRKQNEASADVSRAEQLMRLNTGYTDNRKKSYDNVVDQLLQLIFKLNEEIGALAR